MFKFSFILLSLLLQSCSNTIKPNSDDRGYFADASDCFHSSEMKEFVKVPTGGTMTVVEVPISNDANGFSLCMAHKGRSTTQVNADDYLAVSRNCLQTARDAATPDNAYASCVQHEKVSVDIIHPNK